MNKLAFALALALALAACSGSSDVTSVPEAAVKIVEPPAKPAPPPAPKLTFGPSEPGPAYVIAGGGIVAVMPDGTAKLVAGTPSSMRLVTLGLDGAVYAADSESPIGLYKISGTAATKLGVVPVRRSTAFAVGKDGVAYVAGDEDVYRFDGKRGTKLERPTTPAAVTELAFDPAGNLVAAGNGGASVLVGDTWKPLAIPRLDATDQVWLAGDGKRLVVATRHGLAEFAHDKLTAILGNARAIRRPALANGILGLYQFGKKHPVTELYDRHGAMVTSERFSRSTATVFDARGRLWYVAGGSLVVESLLGGERTVYPPGTLSGLIKVGDGMAADQLVVIGGGPTTLPPIGAVPVVEVVTGKIMIGAAPLANAEVEICSSASMTYRTSPCGGNGTRLTTTTTASGELSFAKVPVGTYDLAFKTGSRWGISTSKISLLKAAPSTSVGTLRY